MNIIVSVQCVKVNIIVSVQVKVNIMKSVQVKVIQMHSLAILDHKPAQRVVLK